MVSLPERQVWMILVALCIGSRAAASIYYLADPDSLRFALSIVDYDLARLQPHFPGYPIFSLLVAAFYQLTGSFALSFGVVGGIATALVLGAALRLLGEDPRSPRGASLVGLIFFNPMLWIMAERYMPDLLGLAVALWALHLLIDAVARNNDRHAFAGVALAGLLAGVRLSYLPLLLLPLLDLFRVRADRMRLIAAGIGAVAVWLLPLLLLTGPEAFLAAATMQTSGHFNEFGGTIGTEPDLLLRIARFLEAVLQHGLGFFESGRHPLTLVATVLLGSAFVVGVIASAPAIRRRRMILAALLLYALWIFFYQNVVHQTRHVLPLIPFVLIVIATGGRVMIERHRRTAILFVAGLAGYAIVGAQLVEQHRSPTAIAQVTEYLRSRATAGSEIVGDPLVIFMLQRQGLPGRFHEVTGRRDSLLATFPPGSDPIIIGEIEEPAGYRSRRFFHNPYVNPVWPAITLHERADVR